MKLLTKQHIQVIDKWMNSHARPYDLAKWNHLIHHGSKIDIVHEMLKYQNPDGGMGSGFEPDVICPNSAAIPTAEAIFQAYEYGLDCTSEWMKHILSYFEHSVQNIPKYWEDCPKEAMDYPHAPWWMYQPCTVFNPNPCGAVASAMIRYGTDAQKQLGYQIAVDCLKLLVSNDFCGDHDTLNILALVEQLIAMKSPLITDAIVSSMKRRILENTCFDVSKYREYYFTPLDFVTAPGSLWYDVVGHGIEATFDFWFDSMTDDGVWEPNFSWGIDSDVSRQVTTYWTGYLTVKRVKILKNFNRIER
jgi:hypothetical protein